MDIVREQAVESWFSREMRSAPAELSGGFFVSHLGFYDVQDSLARDTLLAVAVAMSVAVVVLLACTLDVVLSLAAVICVSGIIFVSVAALIMLGWRLNILESVAITLAIGLSVDFTLHYAVKFRQAPPGAKKGERGGNAAHRVAYAASQTAGPVAMAALTTLLAGACLLPTRVLAYIQIGTFIVIVMATSWFFSTFFLLSVLCIACPGPDLSSCREQKDCLKVREEEEEDNVAEEKSVVVASISFDEAAVGGPRHAATGMSPDTTLQQSRYGREGVSLVSRNPSACDIIRQPSAVPPKTDATAIATTGSTSSLSKRTPEWTLREEKQSVQNGIAKIKANKRRQKQQLQQQVGQQHQQGRFVFERPDDGTAVAPSGDIRHVLWPDF